MLLNIRYLKIHKVSSRILYIYNIYIKYIYILKQGCSNNCTELHAAVNDASLQTGLHYWHTNTVQIAYHSSLVLIHDFLGLQSIKIRLSLTSMKDQVSK